MQVFKDMWLPVSVFVAFVGLVVGIFYCVIRADQHDERIRMERYAAMAYNNGDIVCMKAFGHKGMVIGRGLWSGEHYIVRFSAMQSVTNTRVFGSDEPISVAPVSDVKVREFELESC